MRVVFGAVVSLWGGYVMGAEGEEDADAVSTRRLLSLQLLNNGGNDCYEGFGISC